MSSGWENTRGFLVDALGPPGIYGVFEDDGETGYLYLYEPAGKKIYRHLHIYDRNSGIQVREQDVRVVWSEDFVKVGVLIWGKMRGIINTETCQEGRVWLDSHDSPGISDEQWLEGFQP